MSPYIFILPAFFMGAGVGWVAGMFRGARIAKDVYAEGLDDLLRTVRGRSSP